MLIGIMLVLLIIVIGVFYFLKNKQTKIDISFKGPSPPKIDISFKGQSPPKIDLFDKSEGDEIEYNKQYIPSSMLYMYKTDNMQPIDPFGSIFELYSEPIDNWEMDIKGIKTSENRQFIEQVYLEDKV
tara:strand:- start:471 stop:854 length:384 start_codon:yes stop_codon:yes gene_type:complete